MIHREADEIRYISPVTTISFNSKILFRQYRTYFRFTWCLNFKWVINFENSNNTLKVTHYEGFFSKRYRMQNKDIFAIWGISGGTTISSAAPSLYWTQANARAIIQFFQIYLDDRKILAKARVNERRVNFYYLIFLILVSPFMYECNVRERRNISCVFFVLIYFLTTIRRVAVYLPSACYLLHCWALQKMMECTVALCYRVTQAETEFESVTCTKQKGWKGWEGKKVKTKTYFDS